MPFWKTVHRSSPIGKGKSYKEAKAMRGAAGRFKGKYDLFTIYLVPGATVLLASLDSWTATNLSVLGNTSGNKLLFALWGFITCTCFI